MTVRFSCDAREAVNETDRLSRGPDPVQFEFALAAGLAAVDAKVHELTGRLKASGHVTSEASDGSWEGTIGYARYPGIYELARGDTPTRNHPEGGHFLFDPGGPEYAERVKRALVAFVTGGEEE